MNDAKWIDRSLLAAAVVTPPVTVFVAYVVGLEEVGSDASYAVARPILDAYFPPFFVNGGVDFPLVFIGLYLVFGIAFLFRRRWLYAALVIVVPMILTWWFSAGYLGD